MTTDVAQPPPPADSPQFNQWLYRLWKRVKEGGDTFDGVLDALLDLSGASAGQIKFPASQHASADANTLDDYEEGTWTPTDGSGATLSFTVAWAKYTKVGRFVALGSKITYPSTASGSSSQINGLPFTAADASSGSIGATAGTATYVLVGASSTNFNPKAPAGTAIANSVYSTQSIFVNIFYQV